MLVSIVLTLEGEHLIVHKRNGPKLGDGLDNSAAGRINGGQLFLSTAFYTPDVLVTVLRKRKARKRATKDEFSALDVLLNLLELASVLVAKLDVSQGIFLLLRSGGSAFYTFATHGS